MKEKFRARTKVIVSDEALNGAKAKVVRYIPHSEDVEVELIEDFGSVNAGMKVMVRRDQIQRMCRSNGDGAAVQPHGLLKLARRIKKMI